MITFDQLKAALTLRNVHRFQTHRLQHRQMVDQHSFRAAALFIYLGGKDIIPILFHDIDESITGDLPSPIKKDLQGLEKFEAIRPKYTETRESRLGLLCDKLELVLDLQEQFDDTGILPKKLRMIYEDEKEMTLEIARELGIIQEVKKLLKDLSK
jgi:5'-deoxynucleotidase YfbR-like HD superfamily hydrolase